MKFSLYTEKKTHSFYSFLAEIEYFDYILFGLFCLGFPFLKNSWASIGTQFDCMKSFYLKLKINSWEILKWKHDLGRDMVFFQGSYKTINYKLHRCY